MLEGSGIKPVSIEKSPEFCAVKLLMEPEVMLSGGVTAANPIAKLRAIELLIAAWTRARSEENVTVPGGCEAVRATEFPLAMPPRRPLENVTVRSFVPAPLGADENTIVPLYPV